MQRCTNFTELIGPIYTPGLPTHMSVEVAKEFLALLATYLLPFFLGGGGLNDFFFFGGGGYPFPLG